MCSTHGSNQECTCDASVFLRVIELYLFRRSEPRRRAGIGWDEFSFHELGPKNLTGPDTRLDLLWSGCVLRGTS